MDFKQLGVLKVELFSSRLSLKLSIIIFKYINISINYQVELRRKS